MVKQDLGELKRRFTSEAKKSFKEFAKVQKRSKMMITKHGRYLVEFM